MKPTLPVLLIFLLCFIFAAAFDSYAATLIVTKTADTNDGVCDGDCSLREAVGVAAAGDTVVFSALFNTPQTITLTLGQITIDKNLTINGTGQDLVTVSGNLAGRIFFISNNINVTVTGMRLRDGKVGATLGDSVGGAILMDGGNLNLTGMDFTNNTAFYKPMPFGRGSAVYGFGCTMTLVNVNVHHNLGYSAAVQGDSAVIDIRDSVLESNIVGLSAPTVNMRNTTVTGNGTGVSAGILTLISSIITNNRRGVSAGGSASSSVIIENSTISGNTDAGLDNFGTATIRNDLIVNNSYAGSGGGIINGGTMNVIDSAIIGNSASVHGGGIATYDNLFLTNSTVSGNIAIGAMSTEGFGGGIYFESSSSNDRLTLTNSTIYSNQSKGGGGGIKRVGGGTVKTGNSIIAGNTSTNTTEEDVSGTFTSEGTNLIGNTTGSSGWIASDRLNVNPKLGLLTDNGGGTMTHALLLGSPAIDGGNNSLAVDPQTQMFLIDDQRGFPRRVGVLVDIGAYESTQTASPVVAGSVVYGNTPVGSPPHFVPGVLITGVGSPNVSVMTLGAGPGQGTYLLSGFGSSSYTVTPTKVGGINGLSSFDSSRVGQYVAGFITLTGNQLIVSDVSGNGTLSSFDAAQIGRFVAGHSSNTGAAGNWVFIPVNRTYPSVTSNMTGEDFIALLMGDVTGNWVP